MKELVVIKNLVSIKYSQEIEDDLIYHFHMTPDEVKKELIKLACRFAGIKLIK